MDTSVTQSITVDRDLFDRFLAWQREQEQEQRQEVHPSVTVPASKVIANAQPPLPSNVGTMDAHGFVPTTMQVPTREGGMYGVPEVPDTTEQVEQPDPGDQQQAPYTSPVQAAAPTTPGKRSSRVAPTVADAYVIDTMKSHQRGTSFTIRPPRYQHSSVGLTNNPKTGERGAVADHSGVALSVAQVRGALDRLNEAGRVYKHGKNGKQDRWYVSGDEH